MKEKLSTFRSWLKRLTSNYGITGTVFILSFVFVAIFAYEFLTGFNEPPEPELNLAGQWEVCVSENADSRACKWHSMKIPSDIPKEYLVNFKGWAIYRTKFNAPDICEEQKSACAFFFGEIGDAAEAHLNGKFIGRHGQFPPHAVYAKHYPVSFQIPKESLKRGTVKNELMIIAYSMKKTQAGVRAPPVGIYTVENAFLLSQSAITFNVVMPVLCFVALFVLAFMAFSTAAPELARNPKFTAFVRYGFTNSCFLLSISEVPREYIPIGVAGFLHFALRILSDWSFFELVGAYFEFRPKFMRVIRPFYVLTLLAFIVQFVIFFSSGSDSSLFGRGFDIGFLTLRIAVPLLLLPHAMGIYAAFKMRKEWEGQVALTIFIGTFIFQTHDSLIFHGLASGIYFIKWYPLLVGYIFGLFFLEKARDLRTKAKIEQEQARQMHTIHEAIVGLAHDLEEPFKGVEMAFAELIRRPDNIELVKAIATTFPKKLGRVQELNRAILSFSKELSSAVTLEHEQVDLGKFIEEISDEFRPQPLLQGTVITVKSSSTVLLEIDSSKMRRVFRNLIRNAAEACSGGAGSRIDIEIKKSGGFIEIFISDNGPGISEKIKDRLFHPFESYGKVNGTGLGLAMSKRLVLAHGGDIVLEPSAQGARFKISLLID